MLYGRRVFQRILSMIRSILLLIVLSVFAYSSAVFAKSVLHRGNGAEPQTLDVHRSSGVTEANIQRDLFEGLITEAVDGRLIPGAAAHWGVSENGTLYTFYLQEKGRWSDGTKVTADDFVYAIRRALSPETASDYAFILWPIKNAEALSKGELKDPGKLGIKALDDKTLQINLVSPTPYFLGLLAHHMAYPVPHKAIEAHGNTWTRPGKLISNGPYQLQEWFPQSHITLVKNPHYREASKLLLDGVVYYPTEDINAALKRFRAGELDVTDDVPAEQISWIKEHLPKAFRNSPYIGTYYYALNVMRAPFKDKPGLRKALFLAIDRDILTDKVTRGGEQPAWSWVPEGINEYEQQSLKEKELNRKEHQALAKKLYEQAGYSRASPLEIELLYNTSDNHKKIAIAVAAMWKQVLGVKTRFRNEEWKVYLNSRKQRDFTVLRAGWIGDYNDAYSFLSLFKSDVGEMNPSGYQSSEFDGLLRQAEVEADVKKRQMLMQQAERRLLEDMPIIPVYSYTTQHLVNPKIKGWKDNVMDVHPSRYISILKEY
jgi:oligopeptide transport system substrate-binding protein